MRVCEWPKTDQPQYRLREAGADHPTDSELLSIILKTGNCNSVDLARKLIAEGGSLRELSLQTQQDLQQIDGIGERNSTTLSAVFELCRRISSSPVKNRLKITSPEDIFHRFQPMLGHLKKEVFYVLILNSANHLIKEERISEGILNSTLTHPREIYRTAIQESAAAIILLHNHPSTDTSPSCEDKAITDRLVEVGKIMDIPVLDHIILGGNTYFSFREEGLIE